MVLKANKLNTLLTQKFPEQRWTVQGLVPKDGLVLLSAAPASYKTWFVLDMAIKVAEGKKFLSRFETSQTGVLLVDEESGERILNERFKLLLASDDLPLYYVSRASRLMNQDYVNDIVEFCKQENVGLVIFDSLIRFHNVDENVSSQMSGVLDAFKKIADSRIACIVLHHNKKRNRLDGNSDGDSMRGSSDILASCDIHMVIKKNENVLTVSQSKNRYCEEIRAFDIEFLNHEDKEECEFRMLGDRKTKDEWNDVLKRDIWDFIEENPNMKKTVLVSGFCNYNDKAGKTKVSNLINQMLKDGDLKEVKGERNVKYICVVDRKEEFSKLDKFALPTPEEMEAERQEAIQKAREKWDEEQSGKLWKEEYRPPSGYKPEYMR